MSDTDERDPDSATDDEWGAAEPTDDEWGADPATDDGWDANVASHTRGSAPSTAAGAGTEGDTTFAAITHVLSLLTWVIGPAIVLVASEDEFVTENAKNALNWQIAFSVYMFAALLLSLILIGLPFLVLLPVLDLIVCVYAAVKASEGEAWKYPVTPDIV